MSNVEQTSSMPTDTRSRLLWCATRVAVEHGFCNVSLKEVAQRAGVTTSGLFHYFPNKKALLQGVLMEMLSRLDRWIDESMAQDPEPKGAFTRAYINTIFQEDGDYPWGTITLSMVMDKSLTGHWDQWLNERLERHKETDSDPALEMVRYTVDGIWFNSLLNREEAERQYLALRDKLVKLTY